jgi:DUF4097 and DUF4098 domain-containing protein YvlB
MTRSIAILILAAAALPVTAQQPEKTLECDDNTRNNDRQERFCQMREFTISSPGRMVVDGRTNGGISIKGADRNDVLVRAKVQSWAPTLAEAQSISGQVNVQTAGGNIRADASDFGRERGWAVSYEVFVPRHTGLNLKAHNGGIRISDVSGEIEFNCLNGGVSLQRLGGHVKGSTTNGGLKVELAGSRWDGEAMDVRTTNGGVALEVPENYSARLETGTVNGRISVDFPVQVSGEINRQLAANLGSGGPLIRAYTTNGGVSVKRKR